MRYNLLNVAIFRELPEIMVHLRTILDNYEYFNSISVKIIINMAITVFNSTANIMFDDGTIIDAGTYICRKSIKHSVNHGVSRSELCDFIMLAESIRKKIAYANADLL